MLPIPERIYRGPSCHEESGPTVVWVQADEMVRRGEEMLRWMPDKRGLGWAGMTLAALGRWQRWEARVRKVIEHYEEVMYQERPRRPL